MKRGHTIRVSEVSVLLTKINLDIYTSEVYCDRHEPLTSHFSTFFFYRNGSFIGVFCQQAHSLPSCTTANFKNSKQVIVTDSDLYLHIDI